MLFGGGWQYWVLVVVVRVLGCCDGRLLLLLGIEEWGERESDKARERREKYIYIYKIINKRATIIVHICMVTIAIMHKCTILHPLM